MTKLVPTIYQYLTLKARFFVVLSLTICLIGGAWAPQAMAVGNPVPYDPGVLRKIGVYFYDNSATSAACIPSATLTSATQTPNNVDYAGRPILNAGELKAVNNNAATYQQAAQQVGIPWQMLAAVHYREHDLAVDNPSNGNGPYQITGTNYPAGPENQQEFLAQSIQAAQRLKQAEPNLSATPDPATVKDTFVKYNGEPQLYKDQAAALGFNGATQGYEGSPYVMNFADAKRDPTTAAPGTWLQSVGVGKTVPANSQYGAYLVYASLAGLSVSGGCAVGCSSAQSAAGAAVSETRQNVVCIAQQELQKWSSGQLSPGTGFLTYSQGRSEDWCADFASWVYDQAAYPLRPDPKWNVSYVPNIQTIGQSNQNFHWHPVGGYVPKPGDLAIHGPDHVNIVAGVSGTKITLIGGNQGNNDFDASKVTSYTVSSIGDITGYVSPD